MHKSNALDPLEGFDVATEQLPNGCFISRTSKGEIVRTRDALGVVREFGREQFTNRLMMRSFGSWVKPEGGCLDSAGTLFYTRNNVEIQERLDGVHIHTNRQTGVQIQTDHVNHSEVIRQANGEIWKREVSEESETFEIWSGGALSFRSQSFVKAEGLRMEAATASGQQALSHVAHQEQSFEQGRLTKEKFTFKNPLDDARAVPILIKTREGLLPLRKITAVTTMFQYGVPVRTEFQTTTDTMVVVDSRGNVSEIAAVQPAKAHSTTVRPALSLRAISNSLPG